MIGVSTQRYPILIRKPADCEHSRWGHCKNIVFCVHNVDINWFCKQNVIRPPYASYFQYECHAHPQVWPVDFTFRCPYPNVEYCRQARQSYCRQWICQFHLNKYIQNKRYYFLMELKTKRLIALNQYRAISRISNCSYIVHWFEYERSILQCSSLLLTMRLLWLLYQKFSPQRATIQGSFIYPQCLLFHSQCYTILANPIWITILYC